MGSRVRAARRGGRAGRGKSGSPDRGHDRSLTAPPDVKEGDEAEQEVADSRKRTISRRELERNPRFEEISPEVGELDEEALEQALEEDPDETMALVADLTGATDQALRELARRLAARLFLDVSRRGPARPRGVGLMRTQRYRPDRGDIDIDASLDALVGARARRSAVDPEELRVQGWTTPDTAICLAVDRSGSMGGRPLATAALAASAVAWRAPEDYSVLCFGKEVVAAKSQDTPKSNELVVDSVLALRGFGTTDVAGVLSAAAEQLGRSRAGRKLTILLSDCRSTEPGDAVAAADVLEELVIVAPEDDAVEAEELASATGAHLVTVSGPSDVVAALSAALDVSR